MMFCSSSAGLMNSRWLNKKLSIRASLYDGDNTHTCTTLGPSGHWYYQAIKFPTGTTTIKLYVEHQGIIPIFPATVREIKIDGSPGWSIVDWVFPPGLRRMVFAEYKVVVDISKLMLSSRHCSLHAETIESFSGSFPDSITAIDITLEGRREFTFPTRLSRFKLTLVRRLWEPTPWKLPDFPDTLTSMELFTEFDHGNLRFPDKLKSLRYHACYNSTTNASVWTLPKNLLKLSLTGSVTEIQHLNIPQAVWNLALGLCAKDIPDHFRFPENIKVLYLGWAKSSWQLPMHLEKLTLDFISNDSTKWAFPDTLTELVIGPELKNPVEWDLPKQCSIKYKRL